MTMPTGKKVKYEGGDFKEYLASGDLLWDVPLDAKPLKARGKGTSSALLLEEAGAMGLMVYVSQEKGVVVVLPFGAHVDGLTVEAARHFLNGYRHGFNAHRTAATATE